MAVAVKVALAEPLGMVAEEGTDRLPLFDARATTVAEEALADRVTVQEDEPAPVILVGLQVTLARVVGGVTVTWAVAVPLRVAVRVTGVEAETVPAVVVKAAVVEPWLTTTLAGTETAPLLELKVTVEPPLGAAFDTVTVHEAWAAEARLAGVQVRAVTLTTGCRAMVAVVEAEPRVAVTTAF